MADSVSILSSKNSEKSKLTNSVSRTTSETLRLADPDKAISQPNSLSTSTPKKKTSFQITSVIVGCRSSNDGGDDSADDLDESHTEDISEVVDNSRVTDIENETPSYSEDTFSKDDVFFNASSSLVSAPVIPTSSQYGLAILASTENSESASNQTDNCENSGTTVEVTESVINLGVVSTKHDPEMRDMHPPAPRTERFKVVKIESTEPFKRGRWVCMDYLDHNIAQNQSGTVKTDSDGTHQNTLTTEYCAQESNTTNNVPVSGAPAEEVTQSAVPASAPATVVASAPITEQINNNTANIQSADNNQPVVNNMPISAPSTLPSSYTSVSPGQSLQSNMQMAPNAVVNTQQPQVTQQAQSLSQVHMQQIMANSNQHQSLQSQQMQQVLANANVMSIQQQTQQPQQPQQTQQQPQQQPPPQQQPQQAQMQNQQPIQQPMMQQQMQQIPSMHQPQQQYQPQQQQSMAQQPFQPMQQQQPMMQQQLPPQQTLQPQLQQVHMPQSIPQSIQQMPMQQQQGQPVQQPQMMQQQMPQMPQQPVHQVSYTQQLTQNQPTIVSQPSAQQQVPTGMLPHQIHPQLQNFQQNQMLANMQPQPIMNIQSQPHLQPQYYPTSMPQTSTIGGMLPTMSQGSSLPVSMQGPSATLPPLQTYTSIAQQMQQVPGMPQTPPVQTSVQYSLPCSMAGQQPMSQPLPNIMQQTPQSYASIGSPAQSYASSVVSSLPSSIAEPVSVLSSIGTTSEQPPLAIATDYMPAPTAALLESLAEVTASPDEQQPSSEDPESSSGASAVAIDNKIEQAMDLVKSHLMYAVREEVEVLKEKIAELMERISQLESENNILRAGASPETLAQLPAPQPQQNNNPS
ncbi:uncharacterized protein isoform X2 [Rhodnius prolixus]